MKDKILDIGIGTGLSATGFHSLGLEVYGLDYSNEMLAVCKQKEITADLKQFDLNNTPLPYPRNFFDHISANAILYFIDKLDDLFEEISRIIIKKGIWAFIIQENKDPSAPQIVENPRSKNGLITYKHNQQYILNVIVADNFQMEGKPVSFVLYVTQA